MKTPRFLLGAALLFWGWQTGYLVAGVCLAVVIESAWMAKLRWELSNRDFERLWDFSTGLFLVLAAYAFTANDGPRAFKNLIQGVMTGQPAATLQTLRAGLVFLQWWPMIFFLLVAAQAFSNREQLPPSTFSLLLRLRKKRQKTPDPEWGINLGYPYFAMCLASASIPARQNHMFFPGLCLLVGWALWFHRSRRFSRLAWGGSLALAIGVGFAGQTGIHQLQRYLEGLNPEWLLQFFRRVDFQDVNTELGRIGRLKLSGRIVLRVEPKESSVPPALLREASYQKFNSSVWRGMGLGTDYGTVISETNSWLLLPEKKTALTVQIAQYLHGGRGRLALPSGVARLDDLSVGLLKTNKLGAVLAEFGPGLVIYKAQYGPGATMDAPPTPEDAGPNAVPERERPVLARLAAELGGEDQPTRQKLEAVRAFLAKNFRYSTLMRAPPKRDTEHTPLTYFLLQTHSGHCEYFATATVLLLRQLGVPARYAVGYAVQEKSGNQYLVRERHGHAWCLVYLDHRWQDFDTTPPSWFELETQSASGFQFLSDLWSRLWFEFNRWRWGQTSLRQYVLWVLGFVLALLVLQLFLRKEWKRFRQKPKEPAASVRWPGLDSEIYPLLERLAAAGWPRQPGEALAVWFARLSTDAALAGKLEPIRPLIELHYRYRFDPEGITPAEREQLRDSCRRPLEI